MGQTNIGSAASDTPFKSSMDKILAASPLDEAAKARMASSIFTGNLADVKSPYQENSGQSYANTNLKFAGATRTQEAYKQTQEQDQKLRDQIIAELQGTSGSGTTTAKSGAPTLMGADLYT